MPLKTQSVIQNQAEFEPAKLLFFNTPVGLPAHVAASRVATHFSGGGGSLLMSTNKVPSNVKCGASQQRQT
jgi:hypothetical protein